MQLVRGSVTVDDGSGQPVTLHAGDGVAIAGTRLTVQGVAVDSEVLVFDLGALS